MSRAKCAQCGLVNSIDDDVCRRCGIGMYGATEASASLSPRTAINLPLGKIAIAAAVAFGIYYHTSQPATTPPAPQSRPKPQPTLSSREEHEGQKKQAYSGALKDNPNLKASEQRVAESQKLMQQTSGQPVR